MSYSLGERNNMHATTAGHARDTSIDILERSLARAWAKANHPEHLDEYSAISGDDLARINAFRPTIAPSLWGEVAWKGDVRVRSAA